MEKQFSDSLENSVNDNGSVQEESGERFSCGKAMHVMHLFIYVITQEGPRLVECTLHILYGYLVSCISNNKVIG